MIHLSGRLRAVSAMVTSEGVLADIGTDHAYVPIYLVQRGKIKRAIAMDINKGPLQRADENIAMCNLKERIETRLSDGVAALAAGEADSILVAGMGGELILRILAEGKAVFKKAKEIILQPQSDIQKVREYLRKNGYHIVDEDMVCEDGKYYPMMRVVPNEEEHGVNRLNAMEQVACDIYGPHLLKNGNPVLRRYLVKQHRNLELILARLEDQTQTQAIRERMEEVKKELDYNESAYTIMGAIKNAGI